MPKKRSHGDGALYFLPARGLWRGVVTLEPDPETGKRRQKAVHSKSQAECRRKMQNLEAEIREHGAPLDKTTTVAQWSARWLEDEVKPHGDPNTFSGYSSNVNKWIIPTIGRMRVSAVKPSDVFAVLAASKKAGRKPATARLSHVVLSMMLEAARKEGLCARNVAKDIKAPAMAGGSRDAIETSKAVEMLELAATQELGSMWWFKLLGGPRQGEIVGATLDSLDRVNRVYRVNWKLEEVPKDHGCGDAVGGVWPCGMKRAAFCPDWRWRIPDEFEMVHLYGRFCLTRPKSLTGRAVPIIPQLFEAIDRYIEFRKDIPNPYGLIWRKDDGRPYEPKEDAQAWRDLLCAAGVIEANQLAPGKSPIDGHWARHTTITLLASLGVDAQIIGEIVGHSSEEVTRIYRHVNVREKQEAMERLGGLMLGPGKV